MHRHRRSRINRDKKLYAKAQYILAHLIHDRIEALQAASLMLKHLN